ncbi:MAG: solute carrier family 23 protein, partial [Limnobaculum xujianqingii]
GKIGAFLNTIPSVVMGGIMVLLFGSIAAVGINILVKNRVDLSVARNLCIVSIVLVFGIGGMVFNFGQYSLQGISLCGVIAILLNLILPKAPVHPESEKSAH